MIGKSLGHYEITERLGVGGMGEVYRAKDARLGRDVAIKVLPEMFAREPERVARFEREAKMLAALNHASIAAIYGFEKSGDVHCLVMELVEGETLAELISRGPVAPAEALQIARQVVDALEAAHEKGVIHRDLKPANIKITPEGKVKVLDFGLAKAFATEQSSAQLSQSPTLSLAATNAGVILGTAAYMSPEQAKGSLKVDHRSDIFAFGCVLYEMLSGRQAFHGETIPEVLASVLAREVDFSRLAPSLNPKLVELVRRCLEKDVKKRWHAAGDLRIEIDSILADPRGLEYQPTHARGWPVWKLAALVLLAGSLGAVIALAVVRHSESPLPAVPIRFSFVLPDNESFTAVIRQVLAISPEGKSLVYVANRQLHLRKMAEMQSHPIAGTENALNPFFSPDGQWVGFFQEGALKKISLNGGAALTLCPVSLPLSGASWQGDSILFGQGTEGIFAVPENGGNPELWLKPEADEFADSPQFLPGGKSVILSITKGGGVDRWDKGNVVVFTRDTKERRVLIPGGSGARYVRTGHILYALGTTLMAVPFDAQREKITGDPVPILEGLLRGSRINSSSTANFDLSDTGTLVYVPSASGSAVAQRVLALADRNGKTETLALSPGSYDSPRVSPDGKQVALTTADEGSTIWVYDLSGKSSLRKLTIGTSSTQPRWEPTGGRGRLAFLSSKDGKGGIFLQNSDGTGMPERVTTAPSTDAHLPWFWTPDRKTLGFTVCKNLSDCGIFAVAIEGERKIQTITDEPGAQYNAAISPDGQWLAYVSTEGPTGIGHIFVQRFPSGAKYQISSERSEAPVWSSDGTELFYYQTESAKLVAVRIETRPSFRSEDPVPLPIGLIQFPGGPRQFDVFPGGRFLILKPAPEAAGRESRSKQEIHVVVNWFEELKQRFPTAR